MRLELAVPMTNRTNDHSKDGRIVNGFVETTPYGKSVVKRPGVALLAAQTAGQAKGMYMHDEKGCMYMAIGTQVLKRVMSTGVTTVVGTTNPAATFVSFNATSQVPYVVWQDGYTIQVHNATTGVTKTVSAGSVASVGLYNPGSGYTTPPTVTFTASPTGDTTTGVATINGMGQVVSVTLTNKGSGYIVQPAVTFSAAPATPAAVVHPAVLGVTLSKITKSASSITGITITDPGLGYVTAPTFVGTINGVPYVRGTTTINGAGQVVSATITQSATVMFGQGNLLVMTVTNPPATAPAGVTATGRAVMNFAPPPPYAQGLAYLNDTMYIMTKSAGAIYNSSLEDPLNWGALDYVTKNAEPDFGMGLVKHLHYLLAFGEWSCESWYDAGNPVASPLNRNMSMTLEVGLAHPSTLVQAQGVVFFVGQSRPTGREVYVVVQGQAQKISNNHIERYLNADPFTTVYAFTTGQVGHQIYVLTLKSSNITLVYDVDEKEWTEFSSVVGGVEQSFSEVFAADSNNTCYTLDETNGDLSYLSYTNYQDDSGVINFRIVTPRIIGDETKRIYWYGMELIGDKVVGTASLSYTDDDYVTWSTPRTIDLHAERSVTRSLGAARQRAYSILITGNHPVRLNHINANITQGNA